MSWTKGLGRPPEIIWRQSFFEEGWSSTWMGHSDACTVIWAPILSLSQLSEIFLINYSATFDPGCIFCELLGNNSIMSKADNAQWVSWFLFLDSTQFFNIKIFSKFTLELILIIIKTPGLLRPTAPNLTKCQKYEMWIVTEIRKYTVGGRPELWLVRIKRQQRRQVWFGPKISAEGGRRWVANRHRAHKCCWDFHSNFKVTEKWMCLFWKKRWFRGNKFYLSRHIDILSESCQNWK